MEARVQRVLVWTGPAMVLIWFATFIFVMGFFPPSDPSASAEEIRQLYAEDTTLIRLGLVIVMAASALLVPWAAAIAGVLWRIDGAKALAATQFVSCGLLSLEFITPIGVWMAAAFRFDDRSPEVTEALHDVGWILFVTVIWSLIVQMACIAVAIFIDRGPEPVLPRWLGYLTMWAALLILPAGMVLFFKDGPFAWNGIVGIYIPLAAFVIWMGALSHQVHVALSREINAVSEPARHQRIHEGVTT